MKRNKFSLSHTKLFSCDMGELVPVGLVEVLPGDTIQQSTSLLLRASPLLSPVMHPIDVRIHHWYVPHRLVWDNFEKFITGGPDGLDATAAPFVNGMNVPQGSTGDYLGLPTGVNLNFNVSTLPFRAYNAIWNNWYRDQDLETAAVINTGDGSDITTDRGLKNVSWEKDYFTSSRPWEQKGPSITLPLGTTAPVKGLGFVGDPTITNSVANVRESTPLPNRTYPFALTTLQGALTVESDSNASGTEKPLIYADLQNATAVTINQLRQALALQRYEEARARFGSRYVEYLRYLGVKSSDARLQLPEYLGGGRQTIQFSEVLATAETGSTVKVGDMKGHGIAAMRSNRYRRFFEEHGYVMSLASVRPKTIYMQGVNKTWLRYTKNDYWQKEFEHIGQQAVKNAEVYGNHTTPAGTFGYQDRYDEYRRMESGVAGEFRQSVLNFWHLAREFTSDPALNATFVKCVPTERVFAVNTNDVLWCMVKHSIQARRLLSKEGSSFTF